MSRYARLFAATMVVALLVASGIGTPAIIANDGRPSKLATEELPIDFTPQTLPVGLDRSAKAIVMLKLAGDPVALVKAAKPGKQISDGERQSVEASLKSAQDSILSGIAAAGGRVLGQYQNAYNGIKVEIARRSLGALAALPGVQSVVPVARMERDNSTSVPYIGAPQVWEGQKGLRGEKVKIAIIDTGIDYTHANFGGPGTVAAFDAAFAASTQPADPALFGKNAPKVKGGIDLVGDAYDPNSPDPAIATPRPDPNPLDCNGHGSHVAGTAAGFGVTAAGATYRGAYDASLPFGSFIIGPGVAPKADLYAIRVFGCQGATDVTVDAIDWAVAHEMDVINMSLGSSFGRSDDPSAVASDNAARSGIVVVASAGNSGSSPYITGSPATATRVISVAANDATPSFPGASLALSGGTAAGTTTLASINANAATFTNGLTMPVKVLWTDASRTAVKLGCVAADFADPAVAGKLVVTQRGVCARVARAIYGQQAGALAVVMINTAASYPPFEGPITGNPETGERYAVTIPFLGLKSGDKAAILARDGGSVTLTNTTLPNTAYSQIASFSSGGPRLRDSFIKPDVAAPGVSTLSTASGTGNQGERLSGTSMAAPHVAGVAALVVQAQSKDSRDDDQDGNGPAERVKAAITNTASRSAIAGYDMRRAGAGLVQPYAATRTHAVATGDPGTGSLSFGYSEFSRTFKATKKIRITSLDEDSNVSFNLSAAGASGAPHSVALSRSSVRVEAGNSVTVEVTLSVAAALTGDADGLREVSGVIELTPVGGSNNGVTLRVPYYLVPRGLTNLGAKLSSHLGPEDPSGSVRLTNAGGAFTANADFYAWGVASRNAGLGQTDLRAAGIQSFPASGGRRLMVFAINTWERYSNAAVNEYDIWIDSDGDGIDDFLVVGIDYGLVSSGSRDGRLLSAVYNARTFALVALTSLQIATDNSTVLLPVFSNRLGLSAANPRFSYRIDIFAGRDGGDDLNSASAKFNAFTPAISTGDYVPVAPNGSASSAITIDPTEWVKTPALGVMVVGLDNAAGAEEAILLKTQGD